jgi:endonuclease/exonuclease/phosphatase (EEP) superfamily protein YafD
LAGPAGLIPSLRNLGVAAGLVLAGGCTPVINLPNPTAPRFLGAYASLGTDTASAPIRIVTFNIKLSRRIDRAAEVLSSDSLRGADILALEEMNDVGVDRIARTLHLNYVYYPSFIHPTDHTYFGPAVLSRWPITRSWKLFLPHFARSRGQRRTATVAEVLVRGRTTRVYAVHLETPSGASEPSREDQVRTILADAATFPGPVVIAGDMNGYAVGLLFERAGYHWVTKRLERTISYFAWDHIFVRGLGPARTDGTSAGVVRQVHGASDHRPVWAVVVPEREGAEARELGSP